MSAQSIGLTAKLHAYLVANGVRETPEQLALRELTAEHPQSNMQISPEQGAFMQLLIKLMGATRCLEIGTFTGYSALAMALALPKGGTVLCCDISEDFVSIGRPFWERAGVAKQIDVHIAPAAETLRNLIENGVEHFDFAFIDADKPGYATYYELCLQLVRPGGLIAIDNTLWGGAVVDETNAEEDTLAIRALNASIHQDARVFSTLVPIGDGLTLIQVS